MSDSGHVPIDGATAHTVYDGAGRPFELRVWAPADDPPPSGYPTLYLLDGGAFFGTLVEMIRLRRNRPAMTGIEAAMVVAIGHPDHATYDRERRASDFTPAPDGESEDFLRFITEVVHPFIETGHTADPGRRILVGHSLAGAFVLDALLQDPGSHESYVAISPSIWSYRERLFGAVDAEWASRVPRGVHVAVGVGRYDEEVAPWQSAPDPEALRERKAGRRMVGDATDWASEAEGLGAPRVTVRFRVFEKEDHASVAPVALSSFLRFVVGIEGLRETG